jgi:hypothetical protein
MPSIANLQMSMNISPIQDDRNRRRRKKGKNAYLHHRITYLNNKENPQKCKGNWIINNFRKTTIS